jgi:hypothetical protein
VSCEMGLREGRGHAWRWLPPRVGESGGESADSGEVEAYRRPCSDTRQGGRWGRGARGLVGVEKGGGEYGSAATVAPV